MSFKRNAKAKASDTDSDEEDEAQMRLFLEAADHTLLTNDMFQKKSEPDSSSNKNAAEAAPAADRPKSERYLEEQNAAAASDLQISKEMQTHLWGKLSTIIHDQIEYCTSKQPSSGILAEETPWFSQVKLVSHAECYVIEDIELVNGPQKKPTIKKRQVAGEEDQLATANALASVAVSGDAILKGQDTLAWAKRRPRDDKLFKYKASDAQGFKLLAIERTNEFTKQRRRNGWNESKIGQRTQKKK